MDEYAGTCGEKKVGYSIITDVEGFLKKRRTVQIKSDEYRGVLIKVMNGLAIDGKLRRKIQSSGSSSSI